MHLFITYHARLKIIKAKIDNIIEFPDSYYLDLGHKGQFDNDYDFLKKDLTTLKIL